MQIVIRASAPSPNGPSVRERTYDMSHPDKALRYAFWQHGEFTVEVSVAYTPEEEAAMLAAEQTIEKKDE